MSTKPFGVRQAGLENTEFPTYEKQGGGKYVKIGTHRGVVEPIKGYDNLDAAETDAADRNSRAKALGVKARYEAYVTA